MRLLHQDLRGHSLADFEGYVRRGGSARTLRALYERLLAERFPGHGRVIDKTLNSSRSIGLICGLFAQAPIIWVRRDPLDCAWSAYKTWFHSGIDWSWSLPAIAEHFLLEDRLFAHWTALLGKRIHVVVYEEIGRASCRERV